MKWNRREFLATSSLALAGGFRSGPLFGQEKPLVGTFKELRSGVGTFLCRGGTTTWAISPDAVLIVDSQMMDSAQVLLDGLKTRTKRSQIDAVVNTHYHGDHTGGNAVLKPAAKMIIAHERLPILQRKLAEDPKAPPQVYADTTYKDKWRQSFGKVTLSLVHHGPGHTSGDTVAFFEEAHVASMGDLMYNKRHPNIDREAGGSVRNWVVVAGEDNGRFPRRYALRHRPQRGRRPRLRGREGRRLAFPGLLHGRARLRAEGYRQGSVEGRTGEARVAPDVRGHPRRRAVHTRQHGRDRLRRVVGLIASFTRRL